MSDSSSKEAFRALGAFLAAYMQGKQNDKERADKNRWEQVHYELAKKQIEQASLAQSARNAQDKAALDFERKKYSDRKTFEDAQLAAADAAARKAGFTGGLAEMQAADEHQKALAAAAELKARTDPDLKKQVMLDRMANTLDREEDTVWGQIQNIQKMSINPYTGEVDPAKLSAFEKQLTPLYSRLDGISTRRKALNDTIWSGANLPTPKPDSVAAQSGAAQQPKDTAKTPQKANPQPELTKVEAQTPLAFKSIFKVTGPGGKGKGEDYDVAQENKLWNDNPVSIFDLLGRYSPPIPTAPPDQPYYGGFAP